MKQYDFDERNIRWRRLGDFEHFLLSVLDIDPNNKMIDVIYKFEALKPIVLHRHLALNKSFVIQGEHRLYKPDGTIKEVRPVGSFTSSPASDEPHRECGGEHGAIVYFSIRGSDGVLYEVLDDDQNAIGTLGFQDFVDLFEAENGSSGRESAA